MRNTVRESFLKEQVRLRGPCVKLGSEVWFLNNINIGVGIVEEIKDGVVTLRTEKGLVKKTAADSLMMGTPLVEKE